MNKPTSTLTPKQAALAAISALPEEASFEEIADRLHVLEAIRGGEGDIAAGRTFTHQEVMTDPDLVRRDEDVQKFRALIQEGTDSPPGTIADAAFFEDLRARIRAARSE